MSYVCIRSGCWRLTAGVWCCIACRDRDDHTHWCDKRTKRSVRAARARLAQRENET